MVLAIGIVVDDAIVVVENVERVMEEEPELSPAEATKKAMAQITAPIIAITLVLLSVFVPIAFIPGISGTLFRQFAVTISAAMVISALNALTLSPALCARVPAPHRAAARHHGTRARAASTGCATAMPAACGGWCAWRSLSLVACCRASAAASSASRCMTPTGFLPEEDQGAFFIAVQLPDGASVARTSEVTQAGRGRPEEHAGRSSTCSRSSASRCSTAATQPNSAFMVARLKPFADRKAAADSVQALIRRMFGAGAQIRTANVSAFNLPPIIGLVDQRRLRIPARGAGGPGSGGARQRDAAA